jgi:hypothetical protein
MDPIDMTSSRMRVVAVLAVCCAGLAGCASGPRGSYGFGETAPAASVAITASGTARIAVAGVWQDDLLEPGKRQRQIRTSGEALATVLRSLGQGLAANPALQVAALGQQPIALECPALAPDGQLPPNARACELPARIDPAAWGAQHGKGNTGHLVLVLAITEKTVSPLPTVWGIGPGMPVFSAETSTSHWFRVQARVYDLASGDLLTEASAIDGATGAYGVMMSFIPYYAVPVPSLFLDTMAGAVGAELGRRFQRRSPGVSASP